jgi:ferrous iron transport protein A
MTAALTLAETALHAPHIIDRVVAPAGAEEWTNLLEEIGFLPGETVTIMARGMMGGDPLVVRVGNSTFALRVAEAECVQVLPRRDDLHPARR